MGTSKKHLKKLQQLLGLGLISLALGWASFAAPAPDSAYYDVYQGLCADLAHDIREFDGIQMSVSDRQTLADDWLQHLKDPAKGYPAPKAGSPLSNVWPTQPFVTAAKPGAPVQLKVLAVPALKGRTHSIHNVDQYAAQRLGPALYTLVKQDKVSVVVYGGDEPSLALEMAGRTLEHIPSLYDAWGIEKFLDVTPGQKKPRVIIRVPPIEQYVEHYGMLARLGGTLEAAELNEVDRETHRGEMREAVARLYKDLGQKPDYVVMGYGEALKGQLEGETSAWEMIENPKTVRTTEGVDGTLYKVQSRTNPAIQRSFLAVGAKQTIWGEGSVFLAEGFLEQRPKGIIFMGSAGAPGPQGKVYDVTVPSEFLTSQGVVAIRNDLDRFRPTQKSPKLHFDIRHGNTASPAEQTIEYTTRIVSEGIDTIDVEQSLVARAVAEYNRTHRAGVTFLAANVVTDKPSSRTYNWAEGIDLAHTNPEKKREAKRLAVSTMLSALEQRAIWELGADEERRKLITKAIPGVDETKIFIKNGQGKIDADPKRKLSYYIFTENPNAPESRTLLIPMATSRFDANNYQTDEWWDAHNKEMAEARANGTRAPRQDREEVKAYLRANGLSTNPDVITLDAGSGEIKKEKLREFLLKEYLARYSDGKFVTLYRGAEKPNELDAWKRGEFPHGVRYWTPDANYGWRYGRKNQDFLDLLVKGEAPVFKFKVPQNEFVDLVRGGHLIVGTELTKRVHDSFVSELRFRDQLAGGDYLGDGKYGLEFEIRADGRARPQFPRYFAGAVGIDEFADARIKQIRIGTKRLLLAHPDEAAALLKTEETRVAKVEAERTVLNLVREGGAPDALSAAIAKLGTGQAEIANIDGVNLASFARGFPPGGCLKRALGELASGDKPGM